MLVLRKTGWRVERMADPGRRLSVGVWLAFCWQPYALRGGYSRNPRISSVFWGRQQTTQYCRGAPGSSRNLNRLSMHDFRAENSCLSWERLSTGRRPLRWLDWRRIGGTFSDVVRRSSLVLQDCPQAFRPNCPRSVSPKRASVFAFAVGVSYHRAQDRVWLSNSEAASEPQ